MATTWSAPGGARRARSRAGEGEGEWAMWASGPKGRRLAQQRLHPFPFFLKFFFPQIDKMPFLKPLQTFLEVEVKNSLSLCCKMQIQIPNRI